LGQLNQGVGNDLPEELLLLRLRLLLYSSKWGREFESASRASGADEAVEQAKKILKGIKE